MRSWACRSPCRGRSSATRMPRPSRPLAAARLAPLREHDAAQGTALVETVRAWLEQDARIDAAATALGVHRHTVRARIGLAQRLLATDLTSFAARADLWAALQVSSGA